MSNQNEAQVAEEIRKASIHNEETKRELLPLVCRKGRTGSKEYKVNSLSMSIVLPIVFFQCLPARAILRRRLSPSLAALLLLARSRSLSSSLLILVVATPDAEPESCGEDEFPDEEDGDGGAKEYSGKKAVIFAALAVASVGPEKNAWML